MSHALPELLAPAGSLDALLAAVAAGADAVYCGVGAFNARAAADDISWADFGPACVVAHARGVRVYVTLNVYLREGDLDRAVACARRAAALGADAFIVADAGLARALAVALPGVELHLSTQAGVTGPAGVRLVRRELGVERLCCARELSLDELGELARAGGEPLGGAAPIGIEAFCHGAICICYSGACAASALRRGRSANRGDCTQPCRLPYALVDEAGADRAEVVGDRLLCPCDYLSVRHVPELVAAGVSALKIEGRMKNPDYVHNVVRVYRAVLDAVAAGAELTSADLDRAQAALGRSFNRGFTDAYLRGRSDASLMSFERAINQGVRVGELVERRREEVVVRFDAAVSAGDTLEIRSTPGPDAPADVPKRWPLVPCPRDAAPGELLVVHCKRRVEVGSPVHLTASAGVRAEAAAAVARLRAEFDALARGFEPPAGPGEGGAHGSCGEPAAAAVPSGGRAEPEPVGMPAGPGSRPRRMSVTLAVATPDAARRALADARVDAVAVAAWRVLEDEGAWSGLIGRLVVILDEAVRVADEGRMSALAASARRAVCRNYGAVELARAAAAPLDVAAPLTAAHAAAVAALGEMGAGVVWLPDELTVPEAARAVAASPRGARCGLLVYGVPQLMVCEHCLLTAEGPCAGACAACARRARTRFLREDGGAQLPVRIDALGRTRIFDARPIDRVDALGELAAAGLTDVLVDASLLDEAETDAVLDRVAEVRA